MDQNKLVFTGMGAVTPLGIGVSAYWEQLVSGACGIGPITHFDASALPVQIAAEIKDFVPEDHLSRSLLKETDSFMQYAYLAAEQALEQSGLSVEKESDRIGITMGTAMAGITTTAATQDELSTGKISRVGPRFVPKILGNLGATQIAIAKGIHGPSITVSTACASGGDAITVAAMLLRSGEADAVLCVGGESSACPIVLSSLSNARALSRCNDPAHASRPFDLKRDGFVAGEGGGALLLETEAHALSRGAHILAELSGYGNNSDGYHITAPAPHGVGAAECMRMALRRGGLQPSDIDYINAHGTSTPLGDAIEIEAVKNVFDTHIPALSSTKGATGHLMGAGGITEVITCIQAIHTGILPPTLHYETPDPKCDLDCIPNQARHQAIHTAMSNAFGFGGQNSSIIVSAYS